MRRRHLQPLFDAIDGLPDERKATSAIAVFAVIPAAIVGILGGAVLTPRAAGFEVLLLYGAAGGVAAAAVAVAGVHLARRLFGFRAVARASEAVVGLMLGFGFGYSLSKCLNLDWWPPLLLGPAFAVFNVWLRPFSRRRPADEPKPPE